MTKKVLQVRILSNKFKVSSVSSPSRGTKERAMAASASASAVNAMLRAAETGDLAAVTSAIASGVDVLSRDSANNSALHLASYRGHPEVVKLLLTSKADPSLGNENKDLATHLSALANRKQCLQVLLDPAFRDQVDLEANDSQGYTALHYACGEGHSEIADMLINKYHARIDSRNNDGLTPMMCAVQQGHKELAEMLVKRDAKCLEQSNNSGDTCLHYATISEHGVNMLDMLLRYGADPFIRNKDGLTPLHEATIEKQEQACDLLKRIMRAIRQHPGAMTDVEERKLVVAKVLDTPGLIQTQSGGETETEDPVPHKDGPRQRRRFSSQRAGNGVRAKTSIEIAKEEAGSGMSAGLQGQAPPPKPKSRILRPASSSAFGGL
jgi:ankyrin repeat protein